MKISAISLVWFPIINVLIYGIFSALCLHPLLRVHEREIEDSDMIHLLPTHAIAADAPKPEVDFSTESQNYALNLNGLALSEQAEWQPVKYLVSVAKIFLKDDHPWLSSLRHTLIVPKNFTSLGTFKLLRCGGKRCPTKCIQTLEWVQATADVTPPSSSASSSSHAENFDSFQAVSFSGYLKFNCALSQPLDQDLIIVVGLWKDRAIRARIEVPLIRYRGVSILTSIANSIMDVSKWDKGTDQHWHAVKGIAGHYRRWADEAHRFTHVLRNASFHYISDHHPRMHAELLGWVSNETKEGGKFPEGSLGFVRNTETYWPFLQIAHGKGSDDRGNNFTRTMDMNAHNKYQTMKSLMMSLPGRKWILVGSSASPTEMIALAKISVEFEKSIHCVMIRTKDGSNAMLGEMNPAKVHVFRKARELRGISLPRMGQFGKCADLGSKAQIN